MPLGAASIIFTKNSHINLRIELIWEVKKLTS